MDAMEKYPAPERAFHVVKRIDDEGNETFLAKDRATLSAFPAPDREHAYMMAESLNNVVIHHAGRAAAAVISAHLPDRATHIADISADVAPDLDRAIARLQAFVDSQNNPLPADPRQACGPAIYYADVRAVLSAIAAMPKADAVGEEATLQRGRLMGLEEAAGVCDGLVKTDECGDWYRAYDCATAIRKLKDQGHG